MAEKFCDEQTKCTGDKAGQWTCTAHMGEGPLFTCPFSTYEQSQQGEYPCADAQFNRPASQRKFAEVF